MKNDIDRDGLADTNHPNFGNKVWAIVLPGYVNEIRM